MNRKSILLVCLMVLPLALSACSLSDDQSEINRALPPNCEEIRQAIAESQPFNEQASPSETEILTFLNINPGLVADMVMTMDASLTTPEAIAVITAADEKAVMQVKTAMEDYVDAQRDTFLDTDPEQLTKLENPVIRVRDNQAVLVICDDPDAAVKALTAIWE